MVLLQSSLPPQEASFNVAQVAAHFGVHGRILEGHLLGWCLPDMVLEEATPHLEALSRPTALEDGHRVGCQVAAQEPPQVVGEDVGARQEHPLHPHLGDVRVLGRIGKLVVADFLRLQLCPFQEGLDVWGTRDQVPLRDLVPLLLIPVAVELLEVLVVAGVEDARVDVDDPPTGLRRWLPVGSGRRCWAAPR